MVRRSTMLFGELPPDALARGADLVEPHQAQAIGAVFHLARASTAVLDRLASAMAHAGLTPPRYRLLTLLGFQFPAGSSSMALAEALGVRPPTLTVHLAWLEREGLVKKKRDREDGRAIRVQLTAKGRRQLERAVPHVGEAAAAVLAPLDAKERVALVQLMAKVETGLGTGPNEGPGGGQASHA